jgi:hypothetical protein
MDDKVITTLQDRIAALEKENDRLRAISPPGEWTILYHGPTTFKGRAEFLRLMLEDSGGIEFYILHIVFNNTFI